MPWGLWAREEWCVYHASGETGLRSIDCASAGVITQQAAKTVVAARMERNVVLCMKVATPLKLKNNDVWGLFYQAASQKIWGFLESEVVNQPLQEQ